MKAIITHLLTALFLLASPSITGSEFQNYNDNKIGLESQGGRLGYSEAPATNVPTIETQAMVINAREGDSVVLPCTVKNLAPLTVLWRRNEGKIVLFAADYKITRDSRFKLVNGSTDISIEGVQVRDAGDYTCEVGGNPPMQITHWLKVNSPPHVVTVPDDGLLLVKKGDLINITCVAAGSPAPTVKWKKQDSTVREGIDVDGNSLLIPNATRFDAGIYACEASNGVGTPTVQAFRVRVLYKPEIVTASRYIHSPLNASTEIICEVYAEPAANVTWEKTRDDPEMRRILKFRAAINQSVASLLVQVESVEDYDNYTCIAHNALGRSAATIELGDSEPPLKSDVILNAGTTDDSTSVATFCAFKAKWFFLLWTIVALLPFATVHHF